MCEPVGAILIQTTTETREEPSLELSEGLYCCDKTWPATGFRGKLISVYNSTALWEVGAGTQTGQEPTGRS